MATDQTAISALERKVEALDHLDAPPLRGWIRAIREAVGMSTTDLAVRLGLTRQAIFAMERSEAEGTIQLDTLRRAATALDCRLVYALVPNDSLSETVDRRARDVARRELGTVLHTMALEDQALSAERSEELLNDLADELKNSRRLWRN